MGWCSLVHYFIMKNVSTTSWTLTGEEVTFFCTSINELCCVILHLYHNHTVSLSYGPTTHTKWGNCKIWRMIDKFIFFNLRQWGLWQNSARKEKSPTHISFSLLKWMLSYYPDNLDSTILLPVVLANELVRYERTNIFIIGDLWV